MALSDRWTRYQLRTSIRRELMDQNGRFWGDDELNLYISDWQDEVQNELEFVWGKSTSTVSTDGFSIDPTTVLRPDAFYWNNVRLIARSKNDLDAWEPYWRETPSATPYVCYEIDSTTFGLWPKPSTAGTLVTEYPAKLSFASDAIPMQLPAWTRYSAINYVGYRAYERYGPNFDLNKSLRRKSKFLRQLSRFKEIKASYFPDKYLSIRPASVYENSILSPSPHGDVSVPLIVALHLIDEVPSGSINGTNLTFTLTQNPNPDVSLKLFLDGILMTQGSHYTLSTSTVTFISPYIPQTGQTLFASYIYTT
jgi:hypothetical protein